MRCILLVLVSATTLAMTVPSGAQVYLNGAPPNGVGTDSGLPYGKNDDGRWRNNNWRDGSSDDWRRNNWREDRTDDWRRNNWRENRTDDWRPHNRREDQAIGTEKDKEKDNVKNKLYDDDCGDARNSTTNYPNAPCR
jgi:hypothetical protein